MLSARAGILAPETNAVLGHVVASLQRHEAVDEPRRYATTLSALAHEFSREAIANAVRPEMRWISAFKPECLMF